MNLPFILDVAIGLVFIYLLLSLVASEMQELMATLLQWRARHLKDSIEVLLAGGLGTMEEDRVRQLVGKLYEHPLLRNLNQQAKGLLPERLRQLTKFIPGNGKPIFGKRRSTGPSYIVPETFATSLMESLGIRNLQDKLVEVRLEKFITRIVGTYLPKGEGVELLSDEMLIQEPWAQGRVRLIGQKLGLGSLDQDPAFQALVEDCHDIFQDFQTRQATLDTAVARLSEAFEAMIATCPSREPYGTFAGRLKSFHRSLFGEQNERAIASGGLRPSLLEIAELIDQSSQTYGEVARSYEELLVQGPTIATKVNAVVDKLFRSSQRSGRRKLTDLSHEEFQLLINEALSQLLERGEITPQQRRVYDEYLVYQEFQAMLSRLPQSVKASFASLARRGQTRLDSTGQELNQFCSEIALWFDRSMNRASGVYRRNAKGVALAMGIALAVVFNADSFHILDQLTRDGTLRGLVSDRAAQVVTSPQTAYGPMTREDFEKLRANSDLLAQDLVLPVGWEAANLRQQFQCSGATTELPTSDQYLSQVCFQRPSQGLPTALELVLAKPGQTVQIVIGWLMSGLAISMGAPFWFDLINRVVNVRNTGDKPRSIEPTAEVKRS
jgi:hypothetical protein